MHNLPAAEGSVLGQSNRFHADSDCNHQLQLAGRMKLKAWLFPRGRKFPLPKHPFLTADSISAL